MRVATTDKEHVSGLVNSCWTWRCLGSSVPYVMCNLSPTPQRAMSTDMARDCGSTARRLRDRRLRAVLWHQRLMAAVGLTTVFRHRITTTE